MIERENKTSTGEIIKELLEKQGKKQTDLAKYLGVSPNTVNRWIPNEKREGIIPNQKTLVKIAWFFNVSTDILLGTNENKHKTLQDYSLDELLAEIKRRFEAP